ncbi:OsmC family protein [Algoriphagus persicinus]|uniref:OsmC family protein n=1 Tax=Algoriphagus persicinus TaxID=3108754 RepID=UPI002B3A12F2|nr:OsmC family protein [Algoriphagus sp. E1-3-M2]MEB2786862.1 OsmC family protein [Algoriphagus sp. E1-3-M2]
MEKNSIVQERQQPLMDSYISDPRKAWVTDEAVIHGKDYNDPFHTEVSINDELQIPFRIGVHRAVGGIHDYPNPGDLLCASLAACFESALRMIANRMKITIKRTTVKATANADVRGTLMVDRSVPVGFQSMGLDLEIEVESSVKIQTLEKLVGATEMCCIVYQTLKSGTPIHIHKNFIFSKIDSNTI